MLLALDSYAIQKSVSAESQVVGLCVIQRSNWERRQNSVPYKSLNTRIAVQESKVQSKDSGSLVIGCKVLCNILFHRYSKHQIGFCAIQSTNCLLKKMARNKHEKIFNDICKQYPTTCRPSCCKISCIRKAVLWQMAFCCFNVFCLNCL